MTSSPSVPPAPAARAVLGLGLAALGRPGYINLGHAQDLTDARDPLALRDRAHAVLDAAWDAGVRHFDAARSYGRAEVFLAGWLTGRGLTRADVTVSSKWGYAYTAAWRTQADRHEVKEHSADHLERQWPQSRAVLGRWLSLYLTHSVTPDSGVLDDPHLLARLAAMRAQGVTPGLSLSGPQQAEVLQRALTLRVEGEPVFGAVQATFNLHERAAAGPLLAARAAGWRVYVKEGVANGRLTARAPAVPPPLARVAQRHGVTPDAVALAYVLAQPFADVVLSGAATVAHLQSNLTARDVTLTAADLDELAALQEPGAGYWATRAALPWN
ncbi:aldo/keto reductase [Deinococcus aquiradiocola]|nr:aldo/keto reductase [Deinococcus aquiradiocola]